MSYLPIGPKTAAFAVPTIPASDDGIPAKPAEVVLAGAASVLGKIGTVPAASILYVVCPCPTVTPAAVKVDWRVYCSLPHTIHAYRAETHPLAGTLTLTDATAVDDGDTFIMNGVTFTAKTSGAVAASHEYDLGADNAAAAVNLAALLASANGIPGLTSATITSPTTTDVIALASGTNTALQFAQGTSAANEIGWASGTLANLVDHMAAVTGKAANPGDHGYTYEQWADGWPYCVLALTNNHATDAATVVIGGTVYTRLS